MDTKPTNNQDKDKIEALENINKILESIQGKVGQMEGSDELLSTANKLNESVNKIILIEKLKKLRQEVSKYEQEAMNNGDVIIDNVEDYKEAVKELEISKESMIPEIEKPEEIIEDDVEDITFVDDEVSELSAEDILEETDETDIADSIEDLDQKIPTKISEEIPTSDELSEMDKEEILDKLFATEKTDDEDSEKEAEKEIEKETETETENDVIKDDIIGDDTVKEEQSKKQNEEHINELEDEQPEEEEKTVDNALYTIIGAILLIGLSIPLILWITRAGSYPLGEDVWGHLFKSNTLYKDILNGNFFPLFSELWYNGTEPLRFWAPLPHYILSIIQLIVNGNIVLAYNVFIAVSFVIGGFGWILVGAKTGRQKTGLALAILWFFNPDNLRVLFSEGNLSRVFVNALIPLIIYAVICLFDKRSAKSFVLLGIMMMLASVSHTLTTAIIIASLFVYALIFGIINKKPKEIIATVLATIFGVAIAGIWIYPAFANASFSLDLAMFGESIKTSSQSILEYINPYIRVQYPETYYFSAVIILIALIGLILSDKKSKPAFIITILLFAALPQVFLHLIEAVPAEQLTWTLLATPVAIGACFAGLIMWTKMNKVLTGVLVVLLLLDFAVSFVFLAGGKAEPKEMQPLLNSAINVTTQKVAVLDEGEFESYPSYYLSYNILAKEIQQTFGSKPEKAETALNTKYINFALEKGYYGYVFDRTLELGADSIILKKDSEEKYKTMMFEAKAKGYNKVFEDSLGVVINNGIKTQFGTTAKYKGLGIGNTANYLAYLFPEIEIGNSEYIDDYTLDDLKKYEVVYLSGFKYRNKAIAENNITQFSMGGIKFVIDLTGAPLDIGKLDPSFLGVTATPVTYVTQMPLLIFDNKKFEIENKLPENYDAWKTNYLQNLDDIDGKLIYEKQELSFIGSKINDNVIFMGFNLPKFAIETKDVSAVSILEKIFSLELGKTPDRKIQTVEVEYKHNEIAIKADKAGTIIGIANLDSFENERGEYEKLHNLIKTKDKEILIKFGYAYLLRGAIASGAGLLLLIIFAIVFRKRKVLD